jgi:hypothetical protein
VFATINANQDSGYHGERESHGDLTPSHV